MQSESVIFAAAKRLKGAARSAFLAKECEGDQELLQRILDRLHQSDALENTFDANTTQADVEGTSFHNLQDSELQDSELRASEFPDSDGYELVTPTPAETLDSENDGSPVATSNGPLAEGDTVGPYQLLRPLGQGGMGEVWVAEQFAPVKRKVALKVIKEGVGSKEIIARFEAERQALAMMNHPNIARILDAGTTLNGQPYFVMELVNGLPLTEYCDSQTLGVEERLALFIDVCEGVQHAHQKGIIHRDLKPGNIIVGFEDGKAIPKVIDFGLAKAMANTQRLTDQSLFTGIGQILGTLKYMSPEQASLEADDIDTRTDVYALGIILYELLTGTTPLDDDSIKGQAALKILEFIREKEPTKPSSKLASSTAEEKSRIAATRQTDNVKLNRILAGDLDWIVMRALEKDRNRRYSSATGFADDVRRHLQNEVVNARPPSINYRLQKFVRKNRTGVIAASLLFLSLVAGVVGTSIGMVAASNRAEEERIAKEDANEAREAEAKAKTEAILSANEARAANQQSQRRLTQIENSNEVLESIFDDLNIRKIKADDKPIEAVLAERLVAAGAKIEQGLIGDSVVESNLAIKLGRALLGLGFHDEAFPLIERALNVRRKELGEKHPDSLEALHWTVIGRRKKGILEDNLELAQKVFDLRKEVLGEMHPDTTTSMNELATEMGLAGNAKGARELLKLVAQNSEKQFGREAPDTLIALSNYARWVKADGDLPNAKSIYRRILASRKKTYGERHIDTQKTANELAAILLVDGNQEEAFRLIRNALKINEEELGEHHPDTIKTLGFLADACRKNGLNDEAISLGRQTLKRLRIKYGPDHSDVIRQKANLAGALAANEQIDEAMVLHKEVIQTRTELLGEDHPDTVLAIGNFAADLQKQRRFKDAHSLLKKNLAISKRVNGETHMITLVNMLNLGVNHFRLGEKQEACDLLEASHRGLVEQLGVENMYASQASSSLAVVYRSMGRIDDALKIYETDLKRNQNNLGAEHPLTLRSMNNIAAVYNQVGRSEEAIKTLEEAISIYDKQGKRLSGICLLTIGNLGSILHKQDQLEKALPLIKEAFDARKSYPQLAPIGSSLLDVYARLGNKQETIALAQVLLDAEPAMTDSNRVERQETLRNLAGNLLRVEAAVEAEPLLRECRELDDGQEPLTYKSYATMVTLGIALMRQDKFEQAKDPLLSGYTGLREITEQIPEPARKRLLLRAINAVAEYHHQAGNDQELERLNKEKDELEKSN